MKEYLIDYETGLEIIYNQPSAVGTITFKFTDLDYGDVIHEMSPVAATGPGTYLATIPAAKNGIDRNIRMRATYTDSLNNVLTDDFNFRVRRPYATYTSIAQELGLTVSSTPALPTEITEAALKQYERYAYERINSITASQFNKVFRREGFYGQGSDSLVVEEPVLAVNKVWAADELIIDQTVNPAVYSDGIKVAPNDRGFNLFMNEIDGSLDSLSDAYPVFKKDLRYRVEYIAGYAEVPEAIFQATVMLVNEYRCSDYGVRNHYVVRQENQFGKVENSPMAFAASGNVSVDQLLAPYTRVFMRVI
jgi:hypothetical protein